MQTSVAIVGGGLAGLHAARMLQAAGIDFLLFEARDRLGGRILSTGEAGQESDEGVPASTLPEDCNSAPQSGGYGCLLDLANSLYSLLLGLVLERDIKRDQNHVLALLTDVSHT